MRRTWPAPIAYLLAFTFAACTFPEVTIVDNPECLDDSGCTDGLRCSPMATCVPCVESNHCPDGMVCAPDGTCVQCNGPSDCDGRICEIATNLCVECIDVGDCSGTDVCAGGACAPPHCTNGRRDMDEVIADCGGASCAGCDLGDPCSSGSDCQSGVCADDQCSLPCAIKANCEPLTGTYCAEDGTCQVEQSLGSELLRRRRVPDGALLARWRLLRRRVRGPLLRVPDDPNR